MEKTQTQFNTHKSKCKPTIGSKHLVTQQTCQASQKNQNATQKNVNNYHENNIIIESKNQSSSNLENNISKLRKTGVKSLGVRESIRIKTKKQAKKQAKLKYLKEQQLQPLTLFDPNNRIYKKYAVYWDDLVGIDENFQDLLTEHKYDEDQMSNDEIIYNGILKGLEHLKEAIQQI